MKLLKLIIVIPAINTVSERSFSSMRHLYTYLNMLQSRLNHTMVANEFVLGSEHRLTQFEKFTNVDLRSTNVPIKSCGGYLNLAKTCDA